MLTKEYLNKYFAVSKKEVSSFSFTSEESTLSISTNTISSLSSEESFRNHWLLFIGDGENFKNSSKFKIWGIKSTGSPNSSFLRNVREGDLLWFIQSKTKGKVLALATFTSMEQRGNEPLLEQWPDDVLGWTGKDIHLYENLIHYDNLFNLENIPKPYYTHLKGSAPIRKLQRDTECAVDLPRVYENITSLLHPVDKM